MPAKYRIVFPRLRAQVSAYNSIATDTSRTLIARKYNGRL
jgi:hypothetical protein